MFHLEQIVRDPEVTAVGEQTHGSLPLVEVDSHRRHIRMISGASPSLLSLRFSHDVQVSIRRTCPHDVRAGIAMRNRQAGRFRIEGPHDHPVRWNRDRRTRLVVRI